MKRATITLPDELEEALEAYRRSRELSLPLTALTQAALREYLERRGFLPPSSTPEDFREAAGVMRKYHALSLFDAVAAVVSRRLSLPVWTYDHHFDVVRVGVWHGA
jgi:predicted nucleic acid-binding protein